MIRRHAAALLAAATLLGASSSLWAAGPAGFGPDTAAKTTVADVLAHGADDSIVSLRGRFTKHLEDDKYEFVDEAGTAIRAELDDDRDWSMIAKDQLVDIMAEVDRYKQWIKIDVIKAAPAAK